jgi:hypothetical protein
LARLQVAELDPDRVPLDPHAATASAHTHAAATLSGGKLDMRQFYQQGVTPA